MVGPVILDFQNFKFLVASPFWNAMDITVPNLIKISKIVAELSHLMVFKMAVNLPLGFLNLNLLISAKVQSANVSLRKMSKSAKWFWRYCDYSIIKMTTVCHLVFL